MRSVGRGFHCDDGIGALLTLPAQRRHLALQAGGVFLAQARVRAEVVLLLRVLEAVTRSARLRLRRWGSDRCAPPCGL
ncbi:hypothetical protein Y1Q_0013579 [Alligator mississippiensis]|uniref:Uncharacterized protein n=1 Tax=Alligator mississippiensis TaxID=8496 RepID=A0A151P3B5_ALLMI|nr:hypothetical protein Y1Q_0013579 [Alligator mississippiensis]